VTTLSLVSITFYNRLRFISGYLPILFARFNTKITSFLYKISNIGYDATASSNSVHLLPSPVYPVAAYGQEKVAIVCLC